MDKFQNIVIEPYLLRFGYRSCSSFLAHKRRMVYNLLFHAPLRCFIDIKLLIMPAA